MSIPIIFIIVVFALSNTSTKEKQFIKKLEKEMIEVSVTPLKRMSFFQKRKYLKKIKIKQVNVEVPRSLKTETFKVYSDYLDLSSSITPGKGGK